MECLNACRSCMLSVGRGSRRVRGISIALVDTAGDVIIVVSSGSLLVDTRTGGVGSSSDAVPRPAPSRNGIALRGGNVTIYDRVVCFGLATVLGPSSLLAAEVPDDCLRGGVKFGPELSLHREALSRALILPSGTIHESAKRTTGQKSED
jgi:hypothetical protein